MKTLIPHGKTADHLRNNFDAIRLAMALIVVWSHSFALHLGSNQTEWVSLAMSGTYNGGNLAVMAFFVISGFLITQSWERSTTRRSYFEKRLRRIYPGYLVATSICAFVIAPLFGASFPNVATTVSLNLLLQGSMPEVFVHNPNTAAINGSLWSISYEVWCYVGVALGASLLLRRPRALVVLCLMLISAKVFCDLTNVRPNSPLVQDIFGVPYFWTKIGPSFLMGMIVYSYRTQIPRSPIILSALVGMAFAGCQINQIFADFLVAPALSYSIFYLAFSPRIKLHDAATYGDFSYGTYLYAYPIQQMLQATVGKSLTTSEFIVLSIPLSLLAGVASWHLVEKQFVLRTDKPASAKSYGAPTPISLQGPPSCEA